MSNLMFRRAAELARDESQNITPDMSREDIFNHLSGVTSNIGVIEEAIRIIQKAHETGVSLDEDFEGDEDDEDDEDPEGDKDDRFRYPGEEEDEEEDEESDEEKEDDGEDVLFGESDDFPDDFDGED